MCIFVQNSSTGNNFVKIKSTASTATSASCNAWKNNTSVTILIFRVTFVQTNVDAAWNIIRFYKKWLFVKKNKRKTRKCCFCYKNNNTNNDIKWNSIMGDCSFFWHFSMFLLLLYTILLIATDKSANETVLCHSITFDTWLVMSANSNTKTIRLLAHSSFVIIGKKKIQTKKNKSWKIENHQVNSEYEHQKV